MAEGLLREYLPTHEIFSAGLCALDGACAHPIAVELIWQAGIANTLMRMTIAATYGHHREGRLRKSNSGETPVCADGWLSR